MLWRLKCIFRVPPPEVFPAREGGRHRLPPTPRRRPPVSRMSGPPPLTVSTSGLDSSKKHAVHSHAAALGIVVMPDLTAACTHLVADTVLSDKYLVAVQMRIPVVSVEWMEASACHGEPLAEEDYLLRPLHRLVVCLSGPSFGGHDRQVIESLVRREGGTYSRTLDSQVTHLVVDAAAGEKYLLCCSDPQVAHVRVVSPAWLAACLSRGICADAADFRMHPAGPAPAQLDCSFGPRLLAQSVPELYLSGCVLYIPDRACGAPAHARLVRAARSGGATSVDTPSAWVTHIVLGDAGGSDASAWADVKAACPCARLISHEWLLQCDRLRTFLHPAEYEWAPQRKPGSAARAGAHAGPAAGLRADQDGSAPPRLDRPQERQLRPAAELLPPGPVTTEPPPPSPEHIFLRGTCLLWVHALRAPQGGPRAELLRRAEASGAIILETSGGNLPVEWRPFTGRAYAIADHGADGAALAEQAVAVRQLDGAGRKTRAASWEWLDESLAAGRILSVSEHVVLRPIEHGLPLPGFHAVKVSLTGFPHDSHEKRLAQRLLSLLGAKCHVEFKRSSTHLLAAQAVSWGGKKCERAAELGTPVVTVRWLEECAREGRLVSCAPFALAPPGAAVTGAAADAPAWRATPSGGGPSAAADEGAAAVGQAAGASGFGWSVDGAAPMDDCGGDRPPGERRLSGELGSRSCPAAGVSAPSPRRRVSVGRSPRFCGILAAGARTPGVSGTPHLPPFQLAGTSPAGGAAASPAVRTAAGAAQPPTAAQAPPAAQPRHAAQAPPADPGGLSSAPCPMGLMPPPSRRPNATPSRPGARPHVALGELHDARLNGPLSAMRARGLARHGTMASAEELLRQLPALDPQHDALAGCTRAPGISTNGRPDTDELGSESSVGSSRRHVRRSEIATGRAEEEERPSQPEVRYVDRSQLERQEQIKARMLAASGSVAAGSCGSSDLPSDITASGAGSSVDPEKKTDEDPAARLSELEQVVHAHRAALAAALSPTPAAVCTGSVRAAGTTSSGCGLFAALGVRHNQAPAHTSAAAPAPAARAPKPATGQASGSAHKTGAPDPDADDFAEAGGDDTTEPSPTKRRTRRSAVVDSSGSNRVDGRASASKRARRSATPS